NSTSSSTGAFPQDEPSIYYIPYLKSIGVDVTSINVSEGTVRIKNPVYRSNCRTRNARPVNIHMEGGPFVYLQDHNKFVGIGCNNIALLLSNGSEVSGCVSICDEDNDDISDT
ncbi:Wall-associated receptor kinase-like 22, partial [Mucuna pruriens]